MAVHKSVKVTQRGKVVRNPVYQKLISGVMFLAAGIAMMMDPVLKALGRKGFVVKSSSSLVVDISLKGFTKAR